MGAIADQKESCNRQNPHDRRKRPTRLMGRYTLSGRRKAHRRAADPQINYYVDQYNPVFFFSLILILILSMFDGIFTYHYLSIGGRELNPIMEVLIKYGPSAFFPYKFLITSIGIFILCLHTNFTFVRSLTSMILVLYILLIFYHVGLLYAF